MSSITEGTMTATARRDDMECGERARLRPALPAAILALALAAIAILVAGAPAAQAARAKQPIALPAFGSCQSLLSYAHRNARRTGGGTGVPTRAGLAAPQVLSAPARGVATDTAMPATAPAAAFGEGGAKSEPSFSSTNVQEAGIDEPDIVKTDGRRIFAIADGRLYALDATGDAPVIVGSLDLAGSGGHQMLLRGDRMLVMTTTYGGGPAVSGGPVADLPHGSTTVVLTEVDVSSPEAMAVRRTMQLEGGLVDARLHGASARVVVASTPQYVAPASISSTGVRRYVPRTTLRSRITKRTLRRAVVPCDEVRHPRVFSGLDLTTVLTIDLDEGLFNVDRDAIMAGAQTVYGSPSGLYVASQRYDRALETGRSIPETMRTQIHRFDVAEKGETTYASTGEVTGFVLNGYSLSEHEGALRVASTEQPQWFDGRLARDSESYVTVLAERGRTLRALGRVGGLGKGERIYAVRFVGDRGYVVTFRQTDPLYTLDLSSKMNPRVLGELKILGYSAYLHPVSDDLLLGVGQDATAAGRTRGAQLSLFDVSDPRRPTRLAQAALGENSSSTAEFDPHAFLFWKPANLAVIGLTTYSSNDYRETFQGAVGFRVGSASLGEAGRITHASRVAGEYAPPIARSLVIDDRLYTLSYAGLGVSRLSTLAPLAFAAFPQPPQPDPLPSPATSTGSAVP